METKGATGEETISYWFDLPIEVAEFEEKLGVGAESGDYRIIEKVLPYATLYYRWDCWYFPNRQNKKSQSKNLSNIERNEVKQYGNEICRARYGTVFWNS